MAESELKLDLPCPRCGSSNFPQAERCRQCYGELPRPFGARPPQAVRAPSGGLFDWSRSSVACGRCGAPNPLDGDSCQACGAAMADADGELGGQPLAELEATHSPTRLRNAVRGRRKSPGALSPSALNFAWLLRLVSVLFLFWGVIDTSTWLTSTTKNLAPGDPTGLRYSIFAIYELVRNVCIVGGVWLLTMLNPRR